MSYWNFIFHLPLKLKKTCMKYLIFLLLIITSVGCNSVFKKDLKAKSHTESIVRVKSIHTTTFSFVDKDTILDSSSENVVYDRNFEPSLEEIACNHRYTADGKSIKKVQINSYRPFDLEVLKTLVPLEDFVGNKIKWKAKSQNKFRDYKNLQIYNPTANNLQNILEQIDSFSNEGFLVARIRLTGDCATCISTKTYYNYNEFGQFSDTTAYRKRPNSSVFKKENVTEFKYDNLNRKVSVTHNTNGGPALVFYDEEWSYSSDSIVHKKFSPQFNGSKKLSQKNISYLNEQSELVSEINYVRNVYIDSLMKKEALVMNTTQNEISKERRFYKLAFKRGPDNGSLEYIQKDISNSDEQGRIIQELQVREVPARNLIDTSIWINYSYDNISHTLPSVYQEKSKRAKRWQSKDYSYIIDDQNRISQFIGPDLNGRKIIKREYQYYNVENTFLDLPKEVKRNIFPRYLDIDIPKIKSITESKKQGDVWILVAKREFQY